MRLIRTFVFVVLEPPEPPAAPPPRATRGQAARIRPYAPLAHPCMAGAVV
ncbi:hypothetical protein NOGI109294_04415 [Nocardiopsis gilva]|nr:hypothetical protein [Nocardiopsis gilva]